MFHMCGHGLTMDGLLNGCGDFDTIRFILNDISNLL